MRHFIIDGMLSGTGIRDAGEGGYVSPEELNISVDVRLRLQNWLAEYELDHYYGHSDEAKTAELDREGIKIALVIQNELPDDIIGYYSDAKLRSMHKSDIVQES